MFADAASPATGQQPVAHIVQGPARVIPMAPAQTVTPVVVAPASSGFIYGPILMGLLIALAMLGIGFAVVIAVIPAYLHKRSAPVIPPYSNVFTTTFNIQSGSLPDGPVSQSNLQAAENAYNARYASGLGGCRVRFLNGFVTPCPNGRKRRFALSRAKRACTTQQVNFQTQLVCPSSCRGSCITRRGQQLEQQNLLGTPIQFSGDFGPVVLVDGSNTPIRPGTPTTPNGNPGNNPGATFPPTSVPPVIVDTVAPGQSSSAPVNTGSSSNPASAQSPSPSASTNGVSTSRPSAPTRLTTTRVTTTRPSTSSRLTITRVTTTRPSTSARLTTTRITTTRPTTSPRLTTTRRTSTTRRTTTRLTTTRPPTTTTRRTSTPSLTTVTRTSTSPTSTVATSTATSTQPTTTTTETTPFSTTPAIG